MAFIGFILFLLSVIFSFLIPGLALLLFVQRKTPSSHIFLLSLPVGLSEFILFSYLFAWIHVPYGVLCVPLISMIYLLRKRQSLFLKNHIEIDWFLLITVILGSLFFTSMTVLSGQLTHQGMPFYGVNAIDGLVHTALIKNMTISFPPNNPSLAENSLRGYHYFYDFVVSRFALFYHFSAEDLQFRFFPFFLSFLYGIGFIFFTDCFTKNITVKRFTLFFAYFGQSFDFLYFILSKQDVLGASLGLPFSSQLILDPSVILSIPILFAGLYFLLHNQKNYATAIVAGLCLGILSEVKVYTGLISIGIIVIFTLYDAVKRKESLWWNFTLISVTAFLTAITFLPNNWGAGSLVFAPLLSYQHFIEQPIFQNLHWLLKMQIFKQHGNIIRLIQLNSEAVAIFWFLALGIRSLSLIYIINIFKKSFWQKGINVLLLLLFLIPILWGSLFIQTVSVFDIMQFFWIAVTFISIPAGIIYTNIWEKSSFFLRVLLIVVIFSISASPIYARLKQGLFSPPTSIYSTKQIDFYQFVSQEVPAKSFILVIPPYPKNDLVDVNKLQWYRAPQVAALTGRSTYYEPAIAYYNAYSKEYTLRRETIYTLARDMQNCNSLAVVTLLKKVGSTSVISSTPYTCIGSTKVVDVIKSEGNLYYYKFK